MKYFKFYWNDNSKLQCELDSEIVGKHAFFMFQSFGFPVEMYLEELDFSNTKKWAKRMFEEFIQYTEDHPDEFSKLKGKFNTLSIEQQQKYQDSAKLVMGMI